MTWEGFRRLPIRHVPSLPNGRFIAGTDTDVGKTFYVSHLLRTMRNAGVRVGGYKPVASGFPREDARSDAARMNQALGDAFPLNLINPQCFLPPFAPPIAAEISGDRIDESLLVDGAFDWYPQCDWLLVEGAGGLLSPITWKMTNADLATQMNYPLIIVAANRLGCVHQVLSTVHCALHFNLQIDRIILNCVDNKMTQKDAENNLRLLKPFLQRIDEDILVESLSYESDLVN
jgi:dethiobiotin synthetase